MPDEAERFGAMRSTLERLGLPAPTEVLDPTPIGARGALPVIHRLAAEGTLPRALMCASDQHALDVLDVLRAAGLRAPEDVAVTGFDGVVAGRLASPPLTTVRQPMEAMGRLAADLLIDSLANPGAPVVDMVLPVRVVIRQSCGCPA
jgi:DNA-binding LacI/PurR family transcriptional regulator